jgi:hypothetical protein
MLRRSRRRPTARNARADEPEWRVNQLQAQLEGLQDAVRGEAVRGHPQRARLERQTESGELAPLLSRDARHRGL